MGARSQREGHQGKGDAEPSEEARGSHVPELGMTSEEHGSTVSSGECKAAIRSGYLIRRRDVEICDLRHRMYVSGRGLGVLLDAPLFQDQAKRSARFMSGGGQQLLD